MKQKLFAGKFLYIAIIILALLFPAGVLFDFSPTGAAAKTTSTDNYIESEVVAKIAPDAEVSAIAGKYNLGAELVKSAADGNLYILKSAGGLTTKKIIKLLQKDPEIFSVQPNFKYQQLSHVPNDQYFSREWPLAETTAAAGGVSAPSAWDLETKNQRNVVVAVIDSGANYDHKDLGKNLTKGSAKGKNFDNPKKKPTDSDGHGTFISGIIAAQTNNKRGISGASFFNHLLVMPLKFDFTTDEAISAINYAKAKNIPVINASWGAYGSDGLDAALEDAIAAYPGIFVTASGNNAFDHDAGDPSKKMYPCAFDLPNVVCVAASDRDGNLADYSDYGASSVDVAAPGGTDASAIIGLDKRKSNYASAEGSSLSAAYASAEAGLIFSKYPNLSAAQVIEIIKNSVDIEPSLQGKILTGGKINFQRALSLAASY